MLDQLRRDIQSRIDDLMSEAERLRRALTALTSHGSAASPKTNGSSSAAPSRRRPRPAATSPAPSRTAARPARRSKSRPTTPAESQTAAASSGTTAAPARTAPGATRGAVLTALAGGDAMTASEVAHATGLGRASVSTTLSKLAKSGEVTKAARGYQIAGQPATKPAPSAAQKADGDQTVA